MMKDWIEELPMMGGEEEETEEEYEDDGWDDYLDEGEFEDYGPSNPWDAQGMKISDFITGVRI